MTCCQGNSGTDQMPLYRQTQIYARQGIELGRPRCLYLRTMQERPLARIEGSRRDDGAIARLWFGGAGCT